MLFQQGPIHSVIGDVLGALVILLFLRFILSWFNISQGNPIMLFLTRCTEPMVLPFRRRIPPIGMFDLSFLFVWSALIILRVVLLQALPLGW